AHALSASSPLGARAFGLLGTPVLGFLTAGLRALLATRLRAPHLDFAHRSSLTRSPLPCSPLTHSVLMRLLLTFRSLLGFALRLPLGYAHPSPLGFALRLPPGYALCPRALRSPPGFAPLAADALPAATLAADALGADALAADVILTAVSRRSPPIASAHALLASWAHALSAS
ncbi:hypothetical protein T492DRAFT_860633, partial [Pavlovales sp. CCMP2436]